jgi:D-serine deaminase-like pyridoxal phosphate-dependent protein
MSATSGVRWAFACGCGRTPATPYALEVPGVTEVRAGSYAFNHGRYVRHGFCALADCALAVRATVVSRPARDRAIIDAGRNLLGDGSPEEDDVGLLPDLPGARLAGVWEEHGLIELDGSAGVAVGDVVTIVPHFLRPVVNQSACWQAVRGRRVVRTVRITARGCSA